MAVERTLVLIKPDAVQRGLIGEVITRFEHRGLKVVAAKLVQVDRELATRHYAEHRGKPFFEPLVSYITSVPVLALVLEGERAVEAARQTIGATDPVKAAPGTIRSDLGLTIGRNLVHGSDSPQRAVEEVSLWFRPEEIARYDLDVERWITES